MKDIEKTCVQKVFEIKEMQIEFLNQMKHENSLNKIFSHPMNG